jgi:hypothetical protein
MRIFWLLCLLLLSPGVSAAEVFDHRHAAFSALLARHVQWNAAGTASSVDYVGLGADRAALGAYLATLSAVPRAEFDRWSTPERQAFLINAYNGYTVELILRADSLPASIKDLGSLFTSPWKQRFFTLLGEERHLDDVEHGLLRGAPGFNEPRIHFAVNCASIGCPALRPEAYTAAALDAQLEDQTRRFLRDRSRNRYDAASDELQLSKIFDWYAVDFERDWRGTRSVGGFAAQYADALGLPAEVAKRAAGGDLAVDSTDYDWTLNRR